MKPRAVSAAALFLALVAVGCGGDDGPKYGRVTGDVTFDGAPVAAGVVTFVGTSGGETLGSGSIENGKYSAQVKVGEATVKLSGVREVEIDEKKVKRGYKYTDEELNPELFPAKYNKDSTTTVTIKEGDNKHDFAGQSEPKKKK